MGRIVRYRLDPANPPRISPETEARLDAMTDEELTANALSDPDNPPLTEVEIQHFRRVLWLRRVREATGLDQAAFAHRFGFDAQRLADLELGLAEPDEATEAFFALIEKDPDEAAALVAQRRAVKAVAAD